jgi:hypothetical protein
MAKKTESVFDKKNEFNVGDKVKIEDDEMIITGMGLNEKGGYGYFLKPADTDPADLNISQALFIKESVLKK